MQPTEAVIIAGKYRLLRKLGEGGMGSVWQAEHLTLRSAVAIKLIDVGIANNPEALGRFLREAQSAASLRSPHVVQILDHGVDNGTPYIAMELLDGESLADRLGRVGKLSPLETARIVTHVARAISRAHEAGIVHRDLKPDNIFIVRNDDEEIAKVLDFGIAKSTAHGLGQSVSGNTRTGSVLGTPYYMSPEQAEGAKTLDHRTDIWAVGVIAFECLLGRRPFDAETLGGLLLAICTRTIPVPSRVGWVPEGFDGWFERACARDVSARYPSVKLAAADLKQVCEGLQLSPNSQSASALSSPGGMASQAAASTPFQRATAPVSGHTVPGMATTNQGTFPLRPSRTKRGIILALTSVGLLIVGAWLFAGRLRSGAVRSEPASASALAPETHAGALPPASNVAVLPTPPSATTASANVDLAASAKAPVTAASPLPSSAQPAAKVPPRRVPSSGTPPARVPARSVPTAAPAPKPASHGAGDKVNLGI